MTGTYSPPQSRPELRSSSPATSRVTAGTAAFRGSALRACTGKLSLHLGHSYAALTPGNELTGEDVLLVDADSAFRSLPSALKITIGAGGHALRPVMWMFIAILVTFLVTRTVTRLIRSGSGTGAGLGDLQIAGVHVHHQVFGIFIIIGTGIVLVSATPGGTALDVAGVLFG